ncbi:amino acid permease 2 [Perilla frutescens var. hirtella]|uniref:Amino acid permease 2 n=1 Tax=Perilla frutescens var. hirtella TaxID=608512 RepID=A0AAD4JFT1_PERFH|nr:amino acid permease 2 [Perilla frutescens var. frutescens]KAH6787965.1 amino acid permease 2 [Perilla frutescens var. hirtella]KAH6832997.1 amino acid permease 2 [Perilla frutescens var. hirtella]
MLPRSRTLPARIYDGQVEERQDVRTYLQVEHSKNQNRDTEAINIEANYSKCFDDDGRLKRSGTLWTATSHIITAVIGSGVLSLAWAVGQLGWVAGPVVMILFAFVNLYTSNLLSKCYRSGDAATGQRNYTYMDAVKANLGGKKVKICGLIQYINLFGVAIGYTIAASVSMLAIKRSNCFHKHHKTSKCHMSSNGYMITFGIIEILFSQIPDFDQVWWLSIVAAVMSFTYSTVGLALGVAKVAENKAFKGSLTGISIGTMTDAGMVTSSQKMWRSLQALGAIAFAYSYSIILIEIQDTIKSPPAEHKTMRKATTISIAVTTIFYLLCGCMGYAAFGDNAPGNLLTGFGFFDPYWLLDIANIAIVVHLVGAYQVYCQPLFAFIEKWSAQRWSRSNFVTAEYDLPIPFYGVYQLNFFRLVWRTCFVVLTTLIAMLLPFFNDVVGILGALGFWPLTVYFPLEMYIAQNKIRSWTSHWIGLQMLSMACLLISIAAAVGSVAGVVLDLRTYKPFKTRY